MSRDGETSLSTGALQIAVDIGGTFTDGVLHRQGDDRIMVAKCLTTPSAPGEAVSTVVAALLAQLGDAAAPEAVQRVVHGTTLVTNTLVERRGARAALILTRGTEDALDIRRELRYDTYDLQAEYPQALIPRVDCFALSARTGPDGDLWRAMDEEELARIAAHIAAGGFHSVAVCLLHAPVNDADEQRVKAVLAAVAPAVPVSLSSEVAREIGEYERMSTVAANAYVQPAVRRYLSTLSTRLTQHGIPGALHVMLSNGAFTTAQLGARLPIRILESGPAGGVQSAVNCAAAENIERVLAFDMGGTTAKACVAVDGRPAITHVFEFGRVRRFKRGSGLPAVSPSIDLIEIGAGGGSLASINALGLLQVGPQSAGATPGPACYGLGGSEATVTDADLVLGYLDARAFLGGRMSLDPDSARTALARIGKRLGLDAEHTAWGVHDIVNENMASAARTHIAENGLDARAFTLVATGGAGPVHGVDVARRLRIPRVLCPIASGVGSCLGFLAAPARSDRSWSKVEPLDTMQRDDFDARLEAARAEVVEDLRQCGLLPPQIHWRFSAEIRYIGQGNTVEVPIGSPALSPLDAHAVGQRFEAEYTRLYHKTVPGGEPEVVTWRVSGSSVASVHRFHLDAMPPASTEPRGMRALYRPDLRRYEQVPVFERYALPAGTQLAGPLVLTEPESALVVACAANVRVLPSLSVMVELEGSG